MWLFFLFKKHYKVRILNQECSCPLRLNLNGRRKNYKNYNFLSAVLFLDIHMHCKAKLLTSLKVILVPYRTFVDDDFDSLAKGVWRIYWGNPWGSVKQKLRNPAWRILALFLASQYVRLFKTFPPQIVDPPTKKKKQPASHGSIAQVKSNERWTSWQGRQRFKVLQEWIRRPLWGLFWMV